MSETSDLTQHELRQHEITLYDYWRSSACYRVRIALHLKGRAYKSRAVHLVDNGGEQHSDAHRDLNPQQTVPVLLHGDVVIRQSLAIIEYLDETFVDAAPLLPRDACDRAHVRALAQLVACDIHPLNNLRVVQYLEREFDVEKPSREGWMRHWMHEGLAAFEALLSRSKTRSAFCFGAAPTMADCCLVPQVYNAVRFDLDLTPFPNIRHVNDACLALPAFAAARPEHKPGAG